MKILVTGADGFIGGYLVAELLARGHHVVGLDNLSKYGRIRRTHHGHPNYQLIIDDAGDPELVAELLNGCDHFIAGAALIGGIPYFHTYPFDLLVANERITAAAFTAAIGAHRHGQLRKITLISSSMVYEGATSWPSREGDEFRIRPPLSAYGFQKLAAEYHAHAAWQQYQLPFTIVRPFNCVGVGESRTRGEQQIESGNVKLAMSHVVPDLAQKILKGQDPVHIFGDGHQVRCYTYGGDLAAGIANAVEFGVADNRVYNLSTTEQTTVLQLVDLIWRKVHGDTRPLRLAHDAPYEHDVQCRIPDVTRAHAELDWRATTTLDAMLDEVLPWVWHAIESGEL